MKTKILLCVSIWFAINAALGQGTAFTYQGRLNDNGNPAHGTYDFRFKLYIDPDGNNQAGGTLLTNGFSLTNGLFMATLDFGSGFFNGSNYWLEVDVRTNGGSYQNLAPLQPVLPTPYAVFANTASNVSGTISSLSLSGTYGSAVVFNNNGNSFGGSFSGNGANITNVNALTLNGLSAANFWKTAGNAGTTGANFVGTTDNQALELRVNNQRALRLTPDGSTNNSPNFIGGSPLNVVAPGIVGAAIGGGGAAIYGGLSGTNLVLGDFNTIAGGWGNTTGSTNFDVSEATIAGGAQNTASGISSFIGGGAFNLTYNNNAVVAGGLQNRAGFHDAVVSGTLNSSDGVEAFIGGGRQNTAQTNTTESAIGGGFANSIQGSNYESGATISGGGLNTIQATVTFDGANPYTGLASSYSSIGGGYFNQIQINSVYSTIAGGRGNAVYPNSTYGAIGGGIANVIQGNSVSSTIGGGTNNVIQTGSTNCVIAGGMNNTILAYAATLSGGYNNINDGFAAVIGGGEGNYELGDGSATGGGYFNSNSASAGTISGGQNNFIGPYADHGAIGGGGGNSIVGSFALAVSCTIGGGNGNSIQTNVSYATIGGGTTNTIQPNAHDSTIAGGAGNLILSGGQHSTIGGGVGNTNAGPFATIPGGVGNLAGAEAFAAGTGAQAGNQGSFVWADFSGSNLPSTNNNSVTMRGAGGFRFFSNPAGTLGVYLAPNGSSWSVISDRNAKKNIQALNYEMILDKLSQVPVEQWNYKAEKDSDTPNFGPMAQDFKHAFYPGRDDKSISTLEFDGVEMAAIQGLNQKLQQKDAEIQQLQQSVAKLQQLVSQLAKDKISPADDSRN